MGKVWFITGAGRRGMGVNIAKAALPAGNAVIVTGITIKSRVLDCEFRLKEEGTPAISLKNAFHG